MFQVKTGPFAEHSNQLWNISGVRLWSKVNSGLFKMYKAEVDINPLMMLTINLFYVNKQRAGGQSALLPDRFVQSISILTSLRLTRFTLGIMTSNLYATVCACMICKRLLKHYVRRG